MTGIRSPCGRSWTRRPSPSDRQSCDPTATSTASTTWWWPSRTRRRRPPTRARLFGSDLLSGTGDPRFPIGDAWDRVHPRRHRPGRRVARGRRGGGRRCGGRRCGRSRDRGADRSGRGADRDRDGCAGSSSARSDRPCGRFRLGAVHPFPPHRGRCARDVEGVTQWQRAFPFTPAPEGRTVSSPATTSRSATRGFGVTAARDERRCRGQVRRASRRGRVLRWCSWPPIVPPSRNESWPRADGPGITHRRADVRAPGVDPRRPGRTGHRVAGRHPAAPRG